MLVSLSLSVIMCLIVCVVLMMMVCGYLRMCWWLWLIGLSRCWGSRICCCLRCLRFRLSLIVCFLMVVSLGWLCLWVARRSRIIWDCLVCLSLIRLLFCCVSVRMFSRRDVGFVGRYWLMCIWIVLFIVRLWCCVRSCISLLVFGLSVLGSCMLWCMLSCVVCVVVWWCCRWVLSRCVSGLILFVVGLLVGVELGNIGW